MNIGDLYKAKDEDGSVGWNIVMAHGKAAGFPVYRYQADDFNAQDMDRPYETHDIADDTDIVFVKNLLEA